MHTKKTIVPSTLTRLAVGFGRKSRPTTSKYKVDSPLGKRLTLSENGSPASIELSDIQFKYV